MLIDYDKEQDIDRVKLNGKEIYPTATSTAQAKSTQQPLS